MEKFNLGFWPGSAPLLVILLLGLGFVMDNPNAVHADDFGGAPAVSFEDTEPWLGETRMIDKDSAAVRQKVSELIEGAVDDRERALRIFHFVRDEIAFGWEGAFYAMTATEVLRAERGFCNTKATLFIAMLRAAGIPARQRFVDLRADVLYGLVDTGGPYVDHSYTEVYLDGRWIGVDSYVIDQPLYVKAISRLRDSGRQLGFGVHLNGTIDWDGFSDSFVQFVDDDSVDQLTIRDHGVFADVNDFYASVDDTWNRRAGLRAVAMRFFLPMATRNVERLRSG